MTSAHHDYGKTVLAAATEGTAILDSGALKIDYGAGWQAVIGGVVGDIAVEFEYRDGRPARGTVMDLICHPYAKKLLALMPTNIRKVEINAVQCRTIFERWCPPGSFRVVVFAGTGGKPMLKLDAATLAAALRELAKPSQV
jgi:hypothetical protein